MRAFVIAFAVFLLFLAGATSVMYLASRHAVREAVVRELASAAASSASALSVPAERGVADPELQDMIWRVRESNRLERALLLGRDGKVIASSSGAMRGGSASVFEASPRQVARVLGDARPRTESFQLLGEKYLRIYQPVLKDEAVWGVLCLDAHDPSPHGLSVLNWPFRVGLAVSALSALALAAMGVGVMRFLERRKREMLRVERLVTAGALSASMAHEVKNPMGIILSAAQLLERSGDLTDEGRDLTSTIAEEVRRVESQLDAFLDMARDMPLKLVEEDLRSFLEGTLDLVATRAARDGIALERDLGTDPLPVRFDRRKLRQALVNVILNALEAVRPGEGRVTVRLERGDGDPTEAVVTVADDGPGIPGEKLDEVWEPFSSTKESGTGLGLSQTRQIVRGHGGAIDLASKVGEGTVVTLKLPLAPQES